MAARMAGPRIPVFPRDSAGIQWAGFGVMDSAPVSAAARGFTPPTLYSHTCTQPCARLELRIESSPHEPITPTFHVKHLAPDSTSRRRTCETIEARAMTLRHPDEDMPYQSAAGIARRKSGFSTSGARTQRCTRLRRVGEYGTGSNTIGRPPQPIGPGERAAIRETRRCRRDRLNLRAVVRISKRSSVGRPSGSRGVVRDPAYSHSLRWNPTRHLRPPEPVPRFT